MVTLSKALVALLLSSSAVAIAAVPAARNRVLAPLHYAKQVVTTTNMNAILDAATLRTIDGEGVTPETLPSLARRSMRVKGKKDPYRDAWGHVFVASGRQGIIQIRSAGPDGTLGTADDIVVMRNLQDF